MTVPVNNLVTVINNSLGIELNENISLDQLKDLLAGHINDLIEHNFNKLISILYRIDINESRLKQLLAENSAQDAGRIIAELVIQRQLQKIAYRERFGNTGENSIDENEKW